MGVVCVSRAAMVLVAFASLQSLFVPGLSLTGVGTVCSRASYTFRLEALNYLVVDAIANPDEFGECVLYEIKFSWVLRRVPLVWYLHFRDKL